MEETKDVMPVFLWAREHGEAKVIDRILVKIMPRLVSADCRLTADDIAQKETLELPVELYDAVVLTAQELVGKPYGAKGVN